MKMKMPEPHAIAAMVARALQEDLASQCVGAGDVTARLVTEEQKAEAVIIARETAILAGQAWAEEVFRQVDARVRIAWDTADGTPMHADQRLCTLRGPARALLTGERTALNFLQTLSATATQTQRYVELVAGTGAQILDTRKTLPGLRAAQKYAVVAGGGRNHRHGLYDAYLIKENHILAAGSITAAVQQARALRADLAVETEVETLAELEEALAVGADIVLLDNFDLAQLRQAVVITQGRAKLEASGGITAANVRAVAETGVDYISIGALTKDVRAVDLSMRFMAPAKWSNKRGEMSRLREKCQYEI